MCFPHVVPPRKLRFCNFSGRLFCFLAKALDLTAETDFLRIFGRDDQKRQKTQGGMQMTIYESVKAAVPIRQAAEHYGLEVGRNNMACCPFHNDRHPSMKLNKDYFYCFGCGATGDVIDFAAKLFALGNYDAAQKLATDFGLDQNPPTASAPHKSKRPYIRQFREDETHCLRVLTDYLYLLKAWKVQYVPRTPDDEANEKFVKACQMLDYIESLVDILTVGTLEERTAVVDKLLQEGQVAFLQDYVARKRKEASAYGEDR
jgi:hypothetical protein